MTLHIHRLDRTMSTQDVLHQLAADGAPAGTAVVATEQGAGRGSRGRRWHSPRGGLWLSVLLRPRSAVGLEVLSLRSGLAVAEVLDAIPRLPPVRLKWPNDLMLEDRKVGGLLVEARWQGDTLAWVTIGLGLNVTNPIPSETSLPAVRLADHQPDVDPKHLAGPMVRAILGIGDRGVALDRAELAAFDARDWLRGRELRAPVSGRASGIADDGSLRVRTSEGCDELVRSGILVLADSARDGDGQVAPALRDGYDP